MSAIKSGIVADDTVAAVQTLERIYPGQLDRSVVSNRDSLALHLQRYRFASKQLQGKYILDIACGCGYGTALMAARHPERQFFGVDIDPKVISYAKDNYQAPNLSFYCSNAMTFDKKSLSLGDEFGGFNSIVSLETIEHVPNPQHMVKHLLTQLSEGGHMIASVPTSPTADGNPHHLHDFTVKSFFQLFSPDGYFFQASYEQIQPWDFSGLLSKKQSSGTRSEGVALNVLRHYQKKPFALFSRISSLFTNGLNNRYLTARFARQPLTSKMLKR